MNRQISMFDLLDENANMSDNIIAPFISSGEVDIDPDSWNELKNTYTKEQIIRAFSEEILSGNILLPLRKISEQDMRNSFVDLIRYECGDCKNGKFHTRYEYKYKLSDLYIDESNIGNMASDYFHQINRFKTGSINSPSPVRTWESEKFLRGMLGSLFTLKTNYVNTSTLRTCLSLRKYVASQFKPAIAKSVYEKYGSRYILDFSSGWGDRLCGFYASTDTKHYIGIDPNTALIDGYVRQTHVYSEYMTGKSATFICMPAEDVVLEKESIDTVFTSPPYFNIERYTFEGTQSYKRHKTLDNWLNGFLFKAIGNAWNALQHGGHMIINVSDVYSGHRINKICDPMNDFLSGLGGEYIGCIGMKMAKRPNSKAAIQNGNVFAEPIWIWEKP